MNELTNKTETHREGTHGYPGKVWVGRIVRQFEIDMYKLLCLKWITNKDLWYNIWNYDQCFVASLDGRGI